jgi:hypothetical protein
MASRIHSILPRIAAIVTLPAIGLFVVAVWWSKRPYVVPPDASIFDVVRGRWAWTGRENGCESDWHEISFSADRRIMTIASSTPYEGADGKLDSIATYDIHAHTTSWIRGAIRGEQRRTPEGQPVVWDLVLRAHDRYAWHRTDWIAGTYTRSIERCPAP